MRESKKDLGPMAVATGHACVAGIALGARPVYGYDPRRLACGKTPLVLDSGPAKLSLANYVGLEARFRIASGSRRSRVSLARRARRCSTQISTSMPGGLPREKPALPAK